MSMQNFYMPQGRNMLTSVCSIMESKVYAVSLVNPHVFLFHNSN